MSVTNQFRSESRCGRLIALAHFRRLHRCRPVGHATWIRSTQKIDGKLARLLRMNELKVWLAHVIIRLRRLRTIAFDLLRVAVFVAQIVEQAARQRQRLYQILPNDRSSYHKSGTAQMDKWLAKSQHGRNKTMEMGTFLPGHIPAHMLQALDVLEPGHRIGELHSHRTVLGTSMEKE